MYVFHLVLRLPDYVCVFLFASLFPSVFHPATSSEHQQADSSRINISTSKQFTLSPLPVALLSSVFRQSTVHSFQWTYLLMVYAESVCPNGHICIMWNIERCAVVSLPIISLRHMMHRNASASQNELRWQRRHVGKIKNKTFRGDSWPLSIFHKCMTIYNGKIYYGKVRAIWYPFYRILYLYCSLWKNAFWVQ